MEALTKLRERQAEVRSRLAEIDADAGGAQFTDSQRDEWNTLNGELEANEKHIAELEARAQRLDEIARNPEGRVESETRTQFSRGLPKLVPDDPSDIAAYRNMARDMDQLHQGYQEGALRLVERMVPGNPDANREKAQERVESLLRHVDDPSDREIARRVIVTSGGTYQRAWGKYIVNRPRTREEEDSLSRALSLTTTAGGYAVPYTLDPTIILTSAGVINPVRGLARQVTISGNTWYGVSSTGVTASYGAEVTEASDNAPTLVQPSANVEKAQAFIPMSIEISEDWQGIQAEMSRLFADAKDTLENTQFLTGLGHGSNAPQGLIAVGGATAVVSTAATATLAAADVYSLIQAVSPRFRARGQFVANRAFYDKVRQFDTSGGANMWVQLAYDRPATLVGYQAHEWSAYSSALTTSGSTIATFGDFSNFVIIDRVGMNVELIPHMFATANNRPSGQRGLYCYWRNTTSVVTPGLQANSAFVSLKLL